MTEVSPARMTTGLAVCVASAGVAEPTDMNGTVMSCPDGADRTRVASAAAAPSVVLLAALAKLTDGGSSSSVMVTVPVTLVPSTA